MFRSNDSPGSAVAAKQQKEEGDPNSDGNSGLLAFSPFGQLGYLEPTWTHMTRYSQLVRSEKLITDISLFLGFGQV